MGRRIAMLLIGASVGYFVGFSDAREHDKTVVTRVVERVQGVAKNTVGKHEADVNKAAELLER